MIKFFVYGSPKGKQRTIPVLNKKTGKIRNITPPETVKYEEAVKNSYIIACNDLKLESKSSGEPIKEKYQWMDKEPIAIKIVAQFGIPSSYSKKTRGEIESGIKFPTKTPDADNIAKIVCDGLNDVAYKDDSQIIDMDVKKRYVKGEQKEGVWVTLKEV